MQKQPGNPRAVLIVIIAIVLCTGCAAPYGVQHVGGTYNAPGLMIHTHDNGHLFFHDQDWKLTLNGISGPALVTAADGSQYNADTTISYWNTESAQATGRGSSMKQYLLTILGVILVLGLAGIILYAAFLATDR
jgi:hypothetical protein